MSSTDDKPFPANSFALWRIFEGIPRWYFARGCPPTIANRTGGSRRLSVTVLLATMGLASSWVSTLWLAFERVVPISNLFGNDAALVFAPGVWFGLLVLVPLSRWIGRGWIASLLLVPISADFHYGAVTLYLMYAFNPDDFPVNWIGGAACGLWGGFGVSVWFIELRRPRSWWLVPITAGVGGCVTWGMTIAPDSGPPSMPLGLDWLMNLVGMNLLLSPFQTAVAMTLGLRLWRTSPPPATIVAIRE